MERQSLRAVTSHGAARLGQVDARLFDRTGGKLTYPSPVFCRRGIRCNAAAADDEETRAAKPAVRADSGVCRDGDSVTRHARVPS